VVALWSFDTASTAPTSGSAAGAAASSGRGTTLVATPGFFFSGTRGYQASSLTNGNALDFLRFCASTAGYVNVSVALVAFSSVPLTAAQVTLQWTTSGAYASFGALATTALMGLVPATPVGTLAVDNAAGFCFRIATLPAAPPGPTTLTVDDVQK
jgi:hypothetical protein